MSLGSATRLPRICILLLCRSLFFFFSSRRRHTRFKCDWSSDMCSSDLSVFGDSTGDLWLSTTGNRNEVLRWDHHGRAFHRYSEGLPWLPTTGVSLFAEDASRRLWMGLLRFGKGQPEIARLGGASIERIGGGDDAPSGGIRAIFLDRQKRLWVGTNQNGLMRLDHPEADRPAFRRYTTANGLSSDVILSLT